MGVSHTLNRRPFQLSSLGRLVDPLRVTFVRICFFRTESPGWSQFARPVCKQAPEWSFGPLASIWLFVTIIFGDCCLKWGLHQFVSMGEDEAVVSHESRTF